MNIKYPEKHVPPKQGAVVLILSKSGSDLKGYRQNPSSKSFYIDILVLTLEDARHLLQNTDGNPTA